jgi:hypothetical protein
MPCRQAGGCRDAACPDDYPGFVDASPISKARWWHPRRRPTGQVFNGMPGLGVVRSDAAGGPALFLFDSEADTFLYRVGFHHGRIDVVD